MDESDSFWFFTKQNEPKVALGPDPASNYYKMDHESRGVALILNHVNFKHPEICPTRQGSDKDRDDLTKLFKKFHFEVMVHNDLTYEEICDVLTKVARMDHSRSDCLMVVVMSHGRPNKVYAQNEEYDVKTLWHKFTPVSCPTLAGKPKLFFVQACRGSNLDHGVELQAYTATDSSNENVTYSLPVMADILIMYSTVYGYYSWRNPTNGAYFIQSLVQQWERYGLEADLLTILTYVNKQVAIEYTSEDDGSEYSNCKQMCCIVSMLTKAIRFSDKTP